MKIEHIKKKTAKKVLENAQLEKDIAGMQSVVQERRKSWEATGIKTTFSSFVWFGGSWSLLCLILWPVGSLASEADSKAAEREKRYQKILQVKNLKSLAKTQEGELASLQAEVQRLRRRNFPLLD